MDVRLSRGLFARQRRERQRREKNKAFGINELLSNKSDTVNTLAPYKYQPEILPFFGQIRRIPRACKACVPITRETTISDDEVGLGIGNCFLLDNRNSDKSFGRRMFAEVLHFWQLGESVNFPKLVSTNEVISNPRLEELTEDFSSTEQKMKDFIDLLRVRPVLTWYERFLVRFSCWIASKLFRSAFDGICYHKESLRLLKIASQSGLPIVYAPLYKSALDSYLLKWFFITSGIRQLPLVIEPKSSMDIPFKTKITKLFGGILTYQGAGLTKKSPADYYDSSISASLFSYIRLALSKGNSIQFNLESHRSRSGNPSCFLVGGELLSLLVDMRNNTRELEDCYIVPLSISYEKLPEENILEYSQKEQHCCPKFSWRTLLSSYLGFARVDLSQPFRLREFKTRFPHDYRGSSFSGWELPIDTKSTTLIPGNELQWCNDVGSVPSVCSLYGEIDPLSKIDVDEGFTDGDLQNALAQHIMYDAMKTTSFMSTNLLSFLLLKKFRDGVSLDLLISEMNSLRLQIYKKRRDVGFSADESKMKLVTLRAIQLLAPNVVCSGKEGEVIVKPVFSTKSVLKLGYYANSLVQLFIKEACVSTAILSQVGLSYKALLNTTYSLSSSEDALVQHSLEVGQIMKGEFILNPPCESTETVLKRTIDSMNDNSLLFIHKKKGYVNVDDGDSADDLDDYPLTGLAGGFRHGEVAVYVEKIEFLNDERVWDYHLFLRGLVVPYLEFYRVGLTVLIKLLLPDGEREEIGLRQEILKEANQMLLVESKLFKSEEIITVSTARNFLYHLVSMGIIDSYADPTSTNGKRMYYITENYAKEEKMNALLGLIMTYITY